VPKRLGDTILQRSFVLRSATDAKGEEVTMRKRRNREVIPAEGGEHVDFRQDPGSIPTRYSYHVRWDARPGVGPRTQPAGEIEVGTFEVEIPEQTGHTQAIVRPSPIPRLGSDG
jgi:hypothetical protein